MSYFEVDTRLGDGLILATFSDMGELDQALWSRGKSRKSTKCIVSGLPIKIGDSVYRPVGNQRYRSARILASEIDATLTKEN